VASKGLGPLSRRRGSALAHGCGRGGRGALLLARAAVLSTGLRVQVLGLVEARRAHAKRPLLVELVGGARVLLAWLGLGLRLGLAVRLGLGLGLGLLVGSGLGLGLGFGLVFLASRCDATAAAACATGLRGALLTPPRRCRLGN